MADNKSVYEAERDLLIDEVCQGLQEAVSSIQILTNNLDHLIEVGSGFQPIAKVWNHFHENLAVPAGKELHSKHLHN